MQQVALARLSVMGSSHWGKVASSDEDDPMDYAQAFVAFDTRIGWGARWTWINLIPS